MQVQTLDGGDYEVPFTWSNACTDAGGSGSFTADWQTQVFGPTDANCPTLVKLGGSASGIVKLRYY